MQNDDHKLKEAYFIVRERDAGWNYHDHNRGGVAFPWMQGYWDTFGRVFARSPGAREPRRGSRRGLFVPGYALSRPTAATHLVVSHAGTLQVFRYLPQRWNHHEFIERWESEHIPNCAVASYAFAPPAGRLPCVTSMCAVAGLASLAGGYGSGRASCVTSTGQSDLAKTACVVDVHWRGGPIRRMSTFEVSATLTIQWLAPPA